MALNINGAIPVEVKQADSVEITQFFHDASGGVMQIIYEEKSGGEVIGRKQINIVGDAYVQFVGSNQDLYNNVKSSLYGYMQNALGITGDIV